MPFFMGIDIGTSGVKTILLDERGNIASEGSCEMSFASPHPSWADQEPEDWWKAVCTTIKKAVRGIDAGEVKGIGLSGQMLGATFLDKDLKVIRPCIIWCDQRSSRERDFLEEEFGLEALYEMTANYPLTGYMAPKILWLKENEPENYARVKKVLLPKDYIRLRLTGELATDVSDAGGTYLFDVARRVWSEKLLDALGIPQDFMPKAYESPEITGTLMRSTAEELGLKPGIPVVGGAGDQPAGGIGNGIVEEGVVSATIGTSGVVFACTNSVKVDTKCRGVHSFCHADYGKWSLFGCTLAAGGSLKWLRDKLCQSEKAMAEKLGKDPYVLMDGIAERSAVGSNGLIFLPYMIGERTPYPDPYAKGVFFGLNFQHGWPEMIRSVMEGVAFSLKDSVAILEEFGVAVKQVRASGGGAKSRLWRQIQADIYNAEVITTNVEEAPATGVAILAAAGTKYFGSVKEACQAVVKPVSVTEPDVKNAARYRELYQVYRSLYPALKDAYRMHAAALEI
jgi:xylulokinase